MKWKSINKSNCDKWWQIKLNKNKFALAGPSLKDETLSYFISTAGGIVRPHLLHIMSYELNIFVRISEIFSYQRDNLCQCSKSRLVDIIIKVPSSLSLSTAPVQSVCHNNNIQRKH